MNELLSTDSTIKLKREDFPPRVVWELKPFRVWRTSSWRKVGMNWIEQVQLYIHIKWRSDFKLRNVQRKQMCLYLSIWLNIWVNLVSWIY